jgi:hypothetical protein
MSIATSSNLSTAPQRSMNVAPLLPVVGKMIADSDLSGMFKLAATVLDSNALSNVTWVSLKSIPFIKGGGTSLVKEFDNPLSSRLRYLEANLMAGASFVYNFVFGVFFTVASIVTLGQVRLITDQMKKNWTHSALAVSAQCISLIGTVSPQLGVQANLGALLLIAGVGAKVAQADLLRKVKTAYLNFKQDLKAAVLVGLNNDRVFFDREFAPLFQYLDSQFSAERNTPDAVFFQGVMNRFPRVSYSFGSMR